MRDAVVLPLNEVAAVANKKCLDEITEYAQYRKTQVSHGLETAELDALLFEKYTTGMIKAVQLVAGAAHDVRDNPFTKGLQDEADRFMEEIDPSFAEHRKARWAARPAMIVTIVTNG